MRQSADRRGFSLIELLVALAVFATMAALAYAGLNAVVRTRAELVRQQDEFRSLVRAVSLLERDLRQTAARPIRGNYGEPLPAVVGGANQIELTRQGFANPQTEPRANLERVLYELDAKALKRGSYPVLDRAPGTLPQINILTVNIGGFRLRYLDIQNRWFDTWPPPNTPNPAQLPRAIEFDLGTRDYGEVQRVVVLPSTPPIQAADTSGGPGGSNGRALPPTPIAPAPGGVR